MSYNKGNQYRLRKVSILFSFQPMVKTREKIIRLKKKDEAIINFVNRQAQDAILDPNIPDTYKDVIVSAAIGVIHQVAEGRNAYVTKPKYGHRIRRPQTDEI